MYQWVVNINVSDRNVLEDGTTFPVVVEAENVPVAAYLALEQATAGLNPQRETGDIYCVWSVIGPFPVGSEPLIIDEADDLKTLGAWISRAPVNRRGR